MQPVRVTAMIIRAGLPPANMNVRGWGDWVIAVVDLGRGPVALKAVVELDRDRWLVPGTMVAVNVDPARVSDVRAFQVDWASVPPIQDRVAAGDPTLADPRGARNAAAHALAQATAVAEPPRGGGIYSRGPCSGPSLQVASWSESYDRAVAGAASTPVRPGKVRAVVIMSAVRLLFSDLTHDGAGRPNPQTDHKGLIHWHPKRGTEAVLSVAVPGHPPYPVFVPRLTTPKDKPVNQATWLYPWLPAQVAANDPGKVEILWDELPPWGQVSPTLVPDPDDIGQPGVRRR